MSAYRDIITADFVRKTFRTTKTTNIVFTEDEMVDIFYDECLSPIILGKEEYDRLCGGHIVELHHGEISIMFA